MASAKRGSLPKSAKGNVYGTKTGRKGDVRAKIMYTAARKAGATHRQAYNAASKGIGGGSEGV